MKSYTIVGYQFNCEHFCPGCMLNAISGNSTAAIEFEFNIDAIDGWLRNNAIEKGIDYDNEYSYDSSEYPKVIFADNAGDDICANCEEKLL